MTAAPDFVSYIVSSGVSGLILFDVCVTRKVVVPRWILDRCDTDHARERAEKDALIAKQEATITRLTDLAETQMIPALVRATDIAKEHLQVLQSRAQERHRDG